MPYPLITSYTDSTGRQLILSNEIRDLLVLDIAGDEFFSPGAMYNGYAVDGRYYLAGNVTSNPSATWATQTPDAHRGPSNIFPGLAFVVLTDREVSIIDGNNFTLFLRFTVSEPIPGVPIDGIFLEWVADEDHSSFYSALGVYGMSFNEVAWADGRLVVATNNGIRVFDFKEDTAYVFHDGGFNGAALLSQKGLEYRNKPEYFSATAQTSHIGVTDSRAIAARTFGNTTYYVASSTLGAAVFFWGNVNFFGAITNLKHSVLWGTPISFRIADDGTLYILEEYDPGGGARLRVAKNISEWRNAGAALFNDTSGISLPLWTGIIGCLTLRGSDVFVGSNVGIWKFPEDLHEYELYYGTCDSSIAAPVEPRYDLMTDSGGPTIDMSTDPVTGHLGALHGDVLDIIDVGRNQLSDSYTLTSDPPLPVNCRSLAAYGFATSGV